MYKLEVIVIVMVMVMVIVMVMVVATVKARYPVMFEVNYTNCVFGDLDSRRVSLPSESLSGADLSSAECHENIRKA